MAVFTAVTESQLAEWMRHYDLGDVVEFRGITSGIENSNFFLTTTRGEYVLTIFEKLTAGQLPFYLNLMRHLAAHRVPVPDPMPREDGSLFGMLHGKPAAIVTKLEGAPELAPGVEHCIEVGQMLARMHLAGRDYSGYQPNLRSLPWWKETVPTIVPFLEGEQRELLSSELAYQEAFFASADYAALPEGPCHADLFRDNAMFAHAAPDTGHEVRLGGFFDFYFAGCDKWLFDVAVTVNDWCVDLATGKLDHARTEAMLRAYQTVRPFTVEENRHWGDMLRAGAYRFWVSRLYDFYLPRAAELLKPHDPGHFERILRERLSGVALPGIHTSCN
ncbi:homoserine kinase [Paraburkholderia sp. GV068]|jgi:homoserine kinase type II|uniref:Homoserine kinase n=1 Tax=Paraburkholderia graminis TaxID=60548 RepID=A0ABD5CJY0_9BURK|nr:MULTISPECIES: homoserine kinase [Paraburkholderia]AXF12213.1 homoserine kinase [Paraburkholderia graminis]MDQ0627314.1 homoserine kinase type II [Paraburkholderia graminis]MDR6205540.1 homoserine kinase type II [Paraburkholderia graminis]PTQ93504.1 homoserine kinase [Paraburkholderia sp. GV072]PUB00153.1 homoserine kinase [Paraburkholderia sp. GV068]